MGTSHAYHSGFTHPFFALRGCRREGSAGYGPMDKKKLEVFKKRLEERQRELRQTMTRTAQDGREADVESAQDIADRAANSYNKEFLFHQSNNERQLLQMVDSALDRIREGSFGQCWKPSPGRGSASRARRRWRRAFWSTAARKSPRNNPCDQARNASPHPPTLITARSGTRSVLSTRAGSRSACR
jgi:RNA polymerase-binding transcription factor DksA